MSGWGLDLGPFTLGVGVIWFAIYMGGGGAEGGYMGVAGVGMEILCRGYRPGPMYVGTLLWTE